MTQQRDLWRLSEIEVALGDELLEIQGVTAATLGPILTDTRELRRGAIFVAIRGANRDGHDFVKDAVKAGVSAVIVEKAQPVNCTQIIVKDSVRAYGALARAWRSQFHVPVICVVGSNGKTTTTQMIATILKHALGDDSVVATEGNYNNHIGVPKMLLRFHAGVKAAVIEAGMNHPGEMAYLASLICPTVVAVTNAQREHQEFLDGVMGSARENAFALISLSGKGTAVLPEKDEAFDLWSQYVLARGCHLTTYCEGHSDTADVRCESADEGIRICKGTEVFETNLSLSGRHVMHDAACAAAATMAVGVLPEAVRQGLASFKPVKGRGMRYLLDGGAVIVDDAYNANPDSMRAAIDVLAVMPSPRILVVGDMGEVGENSQAFHAEIGAYAKRHNIDWMFAVGPEMQYAVEAFGTGARHYPDRDALQEAVLKVVRTPVSVLVKASNSQKLSPMVDAIVERCKVSSSTK